MNVEDSGDRLVVRHEARAWFIKLMGWSGVVILLVTIPLAIAGFVGSRTMPWFQLVISLAFGAFGVMLLFRSPLRMEITLDRATKRIRLVRATALRSQTSEFAFSDVRGVEVVGANGPNMNVVTCNLRMEGGGRVPVMLEGGFKSAQSDAQALGETLSATIGVPVQRA